MNIFTVSFFGHQEIDHIQDIEIRLKKIISLLIKQKEYVDFLVGRECGFDLLVSSIVRQASGDHANSSLVLIMPYIKAEFRNNKESFLNYYDDIEICFESSQAHFKRAIQIRNQIMVDRSDLVVCCIQHKSGGAYKTVQYAQKQNCKIINIADENKNYTEAI